MNPVEFAVWAIFWFGVGRVSRHVVIPPLVDLARAIRPGRGT